MVHRIGASKMCVRIRAPRYALINQNDWSQAAILAVTPYSSVHLRHGLGSLPNGCAQTADTLLTKTKIFCVKNIMILFSLPVSSLLLGE